ncbi:MAG: YfjI family protein [Lysobacter sp.]
MNMLSPFSRPSALDRNFAVFGPDLQAVARAICSRAKEADPMMVRTHMLSVLSSAISPLYTFIPPHWDPMPIGVNSLCIAEVGSSKSPVHNAVAMPLKEFADESLSRYDAAMDEFEAHREQDMFRIDLLKGEIKRRSRRQESISELDLELSELIRNKPKPPKHRPRRVTNTDLESMVRQLHGKNEAIDFITDEGEKFFSCSLVRHPADLIDLIDGQSLEFRREKKKHLRARRPCGTFGLMAQKKAVEPFLPVFRKNEYIEHKLVKLGFFCRFLICIAEPMPYGNGYATEPGNDMLLKQFHDKLRGKFDEHLQRLENGVTEPTKLLLAPEATGYWNELECLINHWRFGPKSHIADFVSKILSLTARVSAVLHVWESDTHYVSLSALQRAWELVSWHADHYERVFAPEPPPPQQETDVLAVVEHIRDNQTWFTCREVPIEPIGLLLGLSNNRLRAALLRMEQRGWIEFLQDKIGSINCQKLFSSSRNITWR